MRKITLALTLATLAASSALAVMPAPDELARQLESYLAYLGAHGKVSVTDVDGPEVHAVLHVFSGKGLVLAGNDAASALLATLREEVLRNHHPAADFATGTQLVLLGDHQLLVSGMGDEGRRIMHEVADHIFEHVGAMGLVVRRLNLEGFSGPMASVQLQVRGVELGSRRDTIQEKLWAMLKDDVFGHDFPNFAFLEDYSHVEVLDVRPSRWAQGVDSRGYLSSLRGD